MRKAIIILLLLSFCSSGTNSSDAPALSVAASSIDELVYEDPNGNLVNEDLTNKKTLVVFWADYWGICREELPLLEDNLAAVSQNYDVIALAHSDVDSTMSWVAENL